MSRLSTAVLGLVIVCAARGAIADSFNTIPSRVVAGSDFTIAVLSSCNCAVPPAAAVTVTGKDILVSARAIASGGGPAVSPSVVVVGLARVPEAGTYTVRFALFPSSTPQALGTIAVDPAAAQPVAFTTFPSAPAAGRDFIVSLARPATCGSNKPPSVAVQGNTITLSYEQAPACDLNGSTGGVLPKGTLLPLNAVVRVPASGTYQVVETATAGGVPAITARPIASITVSAPGTATRAAPPLEGLWYSATQPGWGVTIAEGNGGQLFVVWYAYRNRPGDTTAGIWYFASAGQWIGANTFSAPLYTSSGSPIGATFDTTAVKSRPVAMLTLDVASANAITMTVKGNDGYPIDFTQAITRYRF